MEKKSENLYSGSELEQALKTGALTKSLTSVSGMVKPSDKSGYIKFTLTTCEEWIDIPVSIINTAESIGNQSCKDHSHPIMKLTLNESDTEEGKIFLSLLSNATKHSTATPLPYNPNPFYGAPFTNESQPTMPYPTYMPSTRSARLGGRGNFGGVGGFNWGFGPTLPTCGYEKVSVPCGSPLPGYPTPMCDEILYCCTYPSGMKGCM